MKKNTRAWYRLTLFSLMFKLVSNTTTKMSFNDGL